MFFLFHFTFFSPTQLPNIPEKDVGSTIIPGNGYNPGNYCQPMVPSQSAFGQQLFIKNGISYFKT